MPNVEAKSLSGYGQGEEEKKVISSSKIAQINKAAEKQASP